MPHSLPSLLSLIACEGLILAAVGALLVTIIDEAETIRAALAGDLWTRQP